MTRAYLGLGANLGDRDAALTEAARRLAVAGARVVRSSLRYETAPLGKLDQPPFLNLVLEVDTDLDPQALLRTAQGIEADMGRVRDERWGPRPIDVDLLWMDGVTLRTQGLTLPHPRIAERAFVLVPLADLAPDLPVADTTAKMLAAQRLAEGQTVVATGSRPRTRYMGKPLHWLASTTSTNDEARRLAEAGAPEGTAVAARTQTAGRGRLGRSWTSPPGGLWVSVVLRPLIGLPDIPRLGLAVGVAVHRAIERVTGTRTGLRWPNDILLDGRKLGGILAETGPAARWVVVGVGLNTAVPRDLLPAAATSLQEATGTPPDNEAL
ncbi:MAG: 2-amino-4-hydroxy-6-hydroxymethyldihydropteridine diphosphokinase, partial [Armatimonadetes bacterium]|nr:2-amino-4-hydroxy-6-hydroxymethyldihydropteridine diphosphokinase [Armatimonadota bacterium]